MEFKDKLILLRKKSNLSQEELGYAINVTRQTISNWEGGLSSPDLEKIKVLANYFNVSCDELVGLTESDEKTEKTIKNYCLAYEYKSKKTLFGVPLVHINLGFGLRRAKGIIAIGNISTGIISLGILSIGLISFGALSLGLIALGGLAFALLLALGGMSVGTIAIGGFAIGLFAIGGFALGIYSIGGAAFAKEIAFGGFASGKLSFNTENSTKIYTKSEIEQLIELYVPKTWGLIKKIFIALGS